MNVIWIISDTFRGDHLGCDGNKAIRTPSLDAFAARSVRFPRHYLHNFPTGPARADFMSGRFTASFMGWEPYPLELPHVAEILSQKDFLTAGIVDTPCYQRNATGLDRGFRVFWQIPGQDGNVRDKEADLRRWRFESDRYAPQTFSRALEWLEWNDHYKKDFFLLIDTFDPHDPWSAPNYYTELYWPNYDGEIFDADACYWRDCPWLTEERVKKAYATYRGEVTMVDTWVGHFLRHVENMGLMENTAIIFTSDHGHCFGDHGLFGKYVFKERTKVPLIQVLLARKGLLTRCPMYEEIVRVPLIIYTPGTKPGVQLGLTSHVDLMPTVLDIMGVEIPPQVEGRSLLPMVKDINLKGRDFVISTHRFCAPGDKLNSLGYPILTETGSDTTVTTDEWSLLYSPGAPSWLYNLKSDPMQEENVASEHPEVAQELHAMLVKHMYATKVEESTREELMSLKL